MLLAGREPLSRPSEASPKGCLDSGSLPALIMLRRAKRAPSAHRLPIGHFTHRLCCRTKYQNITTEDLVRYFNEELGMNLTAIFD
jgi:hypothetical protein